MYFGRFGVGHFLLGFGVACMVIQANSLSDILTCAGVAVLYAFESGRSEQK